MVPEFQAYVGPRPFEENDKDIFFGRDREARDLRSLVIAHDLVLVYAQSGVGKTSLINAGLIPLLKKKQYEVLPVARIKGPPLQKIIVDEISNIFVFNTLRSWAEGKYDFESLAKMKLVEFLKRQEHPRAIIFDQFEEIFSLYPDRWKDRKGFFEQVSAALEADPLLSVVFVIREEFIARLEPYADLLPERLRTRFHMERLRRDAALQAITEPLRTEPLRDTGRSFAEGVAEKLVDDLLTVRVETMPGKTAEVPGEFIEAVQLQVVCQNLWRELPPDVRQITFQHLTTYGNVEQELYRFYEEAIRAAAKEAGNDEEGLRRLCGEVLITKMGTRGMVCQDPESTGGVPNEAIKILEDKHLIRGEWRVGARWYELTHDSFIKPIQSSNKVFNDKLAEEKRAAEKERAEKELVAEREKAEKELAAERERAEKERLEKERVEKELRLEKELAAEKEKAESRRRTIKILAVVSILLLILAGIAASQWIIAKEKAKEAQVSSLNLQSKDLIGDAKNLDKGILLAIESFNISSRKSMADQLISHILNTDKLILQGSVAGLLIRQGLLSIPHRVVVLNHDGPVSNVVFSPDGKYVATASYDNTARVWNASKGKPILALNHDGPVNNVVFSPDGKYVATASGDNTSRLWDAYTGKQILVLNHDGVVNNVVFSPDGKYIATASYDNTARLWDAATGKQIFVLNHSGPVHDVAFSPDGKYVATASGDSTARVWDATTGKQIFVLNHDGVVYKVVFSPDGKYVATASNDTTVTRMECIYR